MPSDVSLDLILKRVWFAIKILSSLIVYVDRNQSGRITKISGGFKYV